MKRLQVREEVQKYCYSLSKQKCSQIKFAIQRKLNFLYSGAWKLVFKVILLEGAIWQNEKILGSPPPTKTLKLQLHIQQLIQNGRKTSRNFFFFLNSRLRIKRSHVKKKKKRSHVEMGGGVHIQSGRDSRPRKPGVERTSQLWQSSLESKGVKPYMNLLRPGNLHWEDKLPQCLTLKISKFTSRRARGQQETKNLLLKEQEKLICSEAQCRKKVPAA